MEDRKKLYPGCLAHIYNRGSKKELIFIDEYDFKRFLSKTQLYSANTGNQVIQYCLLPNHYHLLIKCKDANSVAKMLQKLQLSHAKYFCKKYNSVGRVFQDRYKSVVIESIPQLKILSRYIHRNPIEYFATKSALLDYPWSSYADFLSRESSWPTKRSKNLVLSQFNNLKEYDEFVSADEVVVQQILKTEALVI